MQQIHVHQSWCDGACSGQCNSVQIAQETPLPVYDEDHGQPASHSHGQFEAEHFGGPPPHSVILNLPLHVSEDTKSMSSSSLTPPQSLSLEKTKSMPESGEAAEAAILDQALDFTRRPPPPYAEHSRLQYPVAVPQVSRGMQVGMPFTRAYSPVLQEHDISVEEFVQFIDSLNVCSTASPPLQVAGLAGSVMTMVPHHVPLVVGHSITMAANLITAAVSKGRTTVFLQKANSDFFAPRGLKVELITGDALAMKLGLRPSDDLVAPFSEIEGLTVSERRMRALAGYVAPLMFNVPPPNRQTTVLERMSAAQVQRQLQMRENKALKDRANAAGKLDELQEDKAEIRADLDKELTKIEGDRKKLEHKAEKELRKKPEDRSKIESEEEREMQKLDEEVEKAEREYEKEMQKAGKDAKKEDKEVRQARKILWIVVHNLKAS